MTTKLNLIVTNDCVYGTCESSIYFKAYYTNRNEMETLINQAKICLFSVGLTHGIVALDYMEFHTILTDEQVITHLNNVYEC